MSALLDKLRAGRRFTVSADGHTYQCTRPTDADVQQVGRLSALDLVKRFVTGWDHTELSLGIPGGTGASAEFDGDLFGEWVADQPQLWAPLSEAIVDAYKQHVERREGAEKN